MIAVPITMAASVLATSGVNAIAGSTLTQDAAVRNVVAAGVALDDAVRAATQTPAQAIGRPDLGRLDEGSLADAVLLDDDLAVRRVWVAGSSD